MKKILIYFFLPASLFLLLFSCGEKKNKEPETQTETRNIPIVSVTNPTQQQYSASLEITGIANPNQQVTIFAMTDGMLQNVKVDIGSFVKKGQILALLYNPGLIQQKEKINAELAGRKSIYDRLKSVYAKTPQLTTIADVEKAQADYESDKAALNGLQSQINFLQVRAPFTGVIVNRFVDKGAIIQNGLQNPNSKPLFELQDIQPIRLTVDVPETNAALINKNTKTEITFPDLPNNKYTATVSRIAYGLDETTKTMKTEIDLPNKDLKIRPGMYAKIDLQISGHKNVLSVPNEAIDNLKGQSFVYVVNGNVVKKVNVKTGLQDEKYTELLNAEIKPTDNIVIRGKEFCSDGAIVQTKK